MRGIAAMAVAGMLAYWNPASARETTILLTPSPTANQSLQTVSGHPAMSSTGTTSGVALILTTERIDSAVGPVFLVGVKNVSAVVASVDAKQIRTTSDAGPVEVLTAEVMQTLIRRQSAAMAQRGSDRAAMARMPGSSINQDENRRLADRKIAGAQAEMGDAAALRNLTGRAVEGLGFRPFKVEPGQTAFAPVTLAHIPDMATKLNFSLEVNGEVHSFDFALTRTSR